MVRWATAVLLLVVASLLAALIWLRRVDGVYEEGIRVPLNSGFAVDGSRVVVSSARCVILRITSDNCPFCSQDRQHFDAILALADRKACVAVALGPWPGDITMTSVAPSVPMQYIDLATAAAIAPVVTPQTLLLDASRRIVWFKQGALSESDARRASQALDAIQ